MKVAIMAVPYKPLPMCQVQTFAMQAAFLLCELNQLNMSDKSFQENMSSGMVHFVEV
jgi:hypothetical protein